MTVLPSLNLGDDQLTAGYVNQIRTCVDLLHIAARLQQFAPLPTSNPEVTRVSASSVAQFYFFTRVLSVSDSMVVSVQVFACFCFVFFMTNAII